MLGRRARVSDAAVDDSPWSCWKESNSERREFRLRRNSIDVEEYRSMIVGRERPRRRWFVALRPSFRASREGMRVRSVFSKRYVLNQ
jgi:hypothetical protein